MKNRQEPAAPEAVFEAIPELEFDETANLTAEARHDQLLHDAGVDAEPISELEFDQTSNNCSGNRPSALTAAGDEEWAGAGCSGSGV